ncbi:MAG: citrate lyase ACP [Candidatus Cloacimonetes bacterium]|nr:citrate lyase ACP [Candidatus Cloacimonadota bacterium]
MGKIATAGNDGADVRSDCQVTLELTSSGGIEIDLTSKVEALYGAAIRKECEEILSYFGICNCHLVMKDSGALSYVIQARLEAAIKQVIDTDKNYLPPMLDTNNYITEKERYRRSRLYLPGNTPKLAINAGLHSPDGIILDLEDSVAPAKKYETRFLVRNTLRAVDFYGAERMVRINQIPKGLEDLEYVIPHNVHVLLVPKCEDAEQIEVLEEVIGELKEKYHVKHDIWLMPIIESALGVINAYSIAKSSPYIVALAIGLEDYTADLGTQRTNEGTETFFARCQLVNAAKAAGIQAIDSVFSDVSDMEALAENVKRSKQLGFDGMGCIHPRQIGVIHENYAPEEAEIERAKMIVNAYILAEEQGLGVVALGSKMIDPPVVKRAQRTIDIALKTGRIDANWRDKFLKEV